MLIASASDCLKLDQKLHEEHGIAPASLMENAAAAVIDAVNELVSPPASVLFLCGPGHNGADGIIAARKAHQAGFRVRALFSSEMSSLKPETANQAQIAIDAGVKVGFPSEDFFATALERVCMNELIVDAILGLGQKDELRGYVAKMVDAIQCSGTPVLSVDVPTGIDTDTGQELGCSVRALRTVTFGFPKPFLFQGLGVENSGFWTVADIGYPERALAPLSSTNARTIDLEFVCRTLPERDRASHKWSNGHVLVVAGSDRMRGAAVLAAKAAMRSGAGLVTVASTREVCNAMTSILPEALTLLLEGENGAISASAAEELLDSIKKVDAAVFGPGLSTAPQIFEFLGKVWADWSVPCCIDADGLSALAAGVSRPKGVCVLTPHHGEAARILGCSTEDVESDRFQAARLIASRFDAHCLLKGPYTLSASPDGEIVVNTTGNSGLASAGMGDVLSGIVGTLLAQQLERHAGPLAACWHGEAADCCLESYGGVGFLAQDVCDSLPAARVKLTSLCL